MPILRAARRPALPQPPKIAEVSKKEIGARLRAIRHSRGFSQSKLAKILGTHFTAISQIERGLRGVTVHQVVKLAKALKISTDEILLNGNGHQSSSLRTGRLLRRLQLVEKLPAADQRAVLAHLDALLKSRGIKPRA
jgi:transcriptional regulator with XRE-family HTH domain